MESEKNEISNLNLELKNHEQCMFKICALLKIPQNSNYDIMKEALKVIAIQIQHFPSFPSFF